MSIRSILIINAQIASDSPERSPERGSGCGSERGQFCYAMPSGMDGSLDDGRTKSNKHDDRYDDFIETPRESMGFSLSRVVFVTNPNPTYFIVY